MIEQRSSLQHLWRADALCWLQRQLSFWSVIVSLFARDMGGDS
jgi:hypothetical protein